MNQKDSKSVFVTREEISMKWGKSMKPSLHYDIVIPKGQPVRPTGDGEFFVDQVDRFIDSEASPILHHDAVHYGIRLKPDQVVDLSEKEPSARETAIREALKKGPDMPEAVRLRLALQSAWPYVHQSCSIASVLTEIRGAMGGQASSANSPLKVASRVADALENLVSEARSNGDFGQEHESERSALAEADAALSSWEALRLPAPPEEPLSPSVRRALQELVTEDGAACFSGGPEGMRRRLRAINEVVETLLADSPAPADRQAPRG